jgi:FKBP-type peptidyl-prolyl cis-trans isomerase
MCRSTSALLGLGCLLMLSLGCGRSAKQPSTLPTGAFEPYVIADSTQIKTYPDGIKIYVVKAGPGDVPQNGDHVKMNYHGMLDDGTVFDESYSRGEPLDFTIGSGKVIEGIESAVRKLRLGSKAIVTIPPALGYGDGKDANGKDVKLPPKIPANARLTFHIDLIGSF